MKEYATPKERAVAALKEFQGMMPTLTGYARAFTRRPDIRIIPKVGPPSTDGKVIYYQPPLELADGIEHIKIKCNKWDANGLQECPACMLRHDVLFDMIHEISHVSEGSTDPLTDHEKTWAVLKATEILGSNPRTRAMAEQIEERARSNRASWLDAAAAISPFMVTISNAFEDARINYKIGVARPGARKMRISSELRWWREGIKSFDARTGEPTVHRFIDSPLNHQAIIGLYTLAVGDEIPDDGLHQKVLSALADERIIELCSQSFDKARVSDSYVTAVQAFVVMREYGFFQHASDQFEEPEPTPPPIEVEEGEDEDDEDSDFSSLNLSPQEGDDSDDEESEGDDGAEGEDFPDEQEAGEDSSESGVDSNDEGGECRSDESEVETSGSDDELENANGQDDNSNDQDVYADDDGDLEDEDEDDEDWDDDDWDDDWEAPPSKSRNADSESDKRSSSDDDPSVDSDPSDSFNVPPSDARGSDVGVGSDEPSEGERESTSDSSDAESEDPSDLEEVDEGGGESQPDDVSEVDEEDADGDDAKSEGGIERSSSDANDGDPEMAGDEGATSGSSEGDKEGDGGEGVGDGDELLSRTETLSDSDRGDGAQPREEDPHTPEEPQEGADEPAPEWGGEDGAAQILDYMLGHDHIEEDSEDFEDQAEKELEKRENDEAMEVAIMSARHFDDTPKNILGLRLHRESAHEGASNVDMALAWTHAYSVFGGYMSSYSRVDLGIDCPLGEQFTPPESVIGSTLLGARLAFTANRRTRSLRGLKSGKVDKRSLGKRAPFDDPRVFHKAQRPGKRDYFVLIGMDVSGSTKGDALRLEKKAVMAEAEVLSRLGINFAIYAHSAKSHEITHTQMSMDLYEVKAPDEPWNTGTRHRLSELGPDGGNVDGHTLEFYRKILDGRKETDLVLQYYTDGAMPASNYHEELSIMQKNIKICNDRGYTLMAVGVGTNSPAAHGFDTIQVDSVVDVARVVQHLGRRLQS